jgi:hypothetical protein
LASRSSKHEAGISATRSTFGEGSASVRRRKLPATSTRGGAKASDRSPYVAPRTGMPGKAWVRSCTWKSRSARDPQCGPEGRLHVARRCAPTRVAAARGRHGQYAARRWAWAENTVAAGCARDPRPAATHLLRLEGLERLLDVTQGLRERREQCLVDGERAMQLVQLRACRRRGAVPRKRARRPRDPRRRQPAAGPRRPRATPCARANGHVSSAKL